MRAWADIKRDELADMFPTHDIWTVRNAVCRHTTWCSRPKGHPTATINANSADELQAEIAEELQAQRASDLAERMDAQTCADVRRRVSRWLW